jgi:hypothetical protein
MPAINSPASVLAYNPNPLNRGVGRLLIMDVYAAMLAVAVIFRLIITKLPTFIYPPSFMVILAAALTLITLTNLLS